MIDRDIDVLIVGGGLVGAMLMLALTDLNVSTLMIEAKPFNDRAQNDFDARTLALSPASVHILQMLNVWPLLKKHATAIENIHISEQGAFGCARLKSQENKPLGQVVEMQYISHALYQLLDPQQLIIPAQCTAFDVKTNIATIAQLPNKTSADINPKELKIRAKLIVAADGADSMIRKFCNIPTQIKDYKQQAIVTNIALARPHDQVAYERFTPIGPMALLPMTDKRVALIWSMLTPLAEQMVKMPEPDFLTKLQHTFGYRLGRFNQVGKRITFPLKQVTLSNLVSGSVVFIGNAAHTLHPIAGQGFNLGLRDIAMLAQCIAKHGLGADMLPIYQQARQHDHKIITHFTDSLIELFNPHFPGAGFARGMGLAAFDNLPFLKRLLSRYARGFGGVIPDLACEIPLRSSH